MMYTQFDADPVLGVNNILEQRQRRQHPRATARTTLGSSPSRPTHPPAVSPSGSPTSQPGDQNNLTINPVYTTGANPVVDPNATMTAIQNALQSDVQQVGINWPTRPAAAAQAGFEGPITVRLLSDQDVSDRMGTYWDLSPYGIDTSQYVYEITFIGEVHNTRDGHRSPAGQCDWNALMRARQARPPRAPIFVNEIPADAGTADDERLDRHDLQRQLRRGLHPERTSTRKGSSPTTRSSLPAYPAVSDTGVVSTTSAPRSPT